VGLAFLLPGLAALGFSLWEGPAAWSLDARTFWGVPISLFVFWIGIAHAGTLISAILLALGVNLDRRTSLLAELTTLCALVVAAAFPLMHLGVVENFYMVIPFADARGSFANVRSPLVWDFCCIAVYAMLSLVYFAIHLLADRFQSLEDLRRPMAWLLFPLVLWVHTIVSLDFAATFVPNWQGAFFPLYFITGAIFSGLAMVNVLLVAEGCRVRLLEKLMLACSFVMLLFWGWIFALRGEWNFSVFAFAALLPQLWWVSSVRESAFGRLAISLSVLVGLWLERYYLVLPTNPDSFGWVDAGLIAFSLGLFTTLLVFLRIKLRKPIEGGELVFGELDEKPLPVVEHHTEPLTSREFIVLRFPLLLGVLVALVYTLWAVASPAFETTAVGVPNVFPLFYPIVALVATVVLCARPAWNIGRGLRYLKIVFIVIATLFAFLAGMFYAGGTSTPSKFSTGVEIPAEGDSAVEPDSLHARAIWNARCSSCHGTDGKFNEKFIREFYPVPQKLTAERLDSLGEDSLVHVIMGGRANMNPYVDRITEAETRALVRYMRSLAPAHIPAPETNETAPETNETAPETNEAAPETNIPAASSDLQQTESLQQSSEVAQ
jgi:mono/diheme cytochrome c family protein